MGILKIFDSFPVKRKPRFFIGRCATVIRHVDSQQLSHAYLINASESGLLVEIDASSNQFLPNNSDVIISFKKLQMVPGLPLELKAKIVRQETQNGTVLHGLKINHSHCDHSKIWSEKINAIRLSYIDH